MNYEKLDSIVLSLKDELLADMKRWIAVPSVLSEPAGPNAPFGRANREMLDLALETARKYGFEARDVDGYAGDVSMGSGEKTLGILCHLDVVPAGDSWTKDPWGAEIEDGKIYGRGTMDDKGPALIALYAMRAVRDAGIPLTDGVRLIWGCDEETGMNDMRHYASKYKMPDYGFSPDAEFPVINIEKGGMNMLLSKYTGGEGKADREILSLCAGERPNVVPAMAVAELKVADPVAFIAEVGEIARRNSFNLAVSEHDGRVRLRAVGQNAHGAQPELGVNAAGMLLIALKQLNVGSASREAIALLADKVGMQYDGTELGIAMKDDLSGALTCNLGILRYDGKNLTAELDIRYPICGDQTAICGSIAMAMSPAQIAVTRLGGRTPLHVPADSKIVQGLLAAYHEVTGLEPYTIAIGGGTYSRMMPNTVAFGLSFPGDVDCCHMPDEHMDIDKMMLSLKILAHAIASLAG